MTPHLPAEFTLDVALVMLNIVLASRASYFNYHEWRHGFKELRWVSGWRTAFAAIYAISYTLLTFFSVDRLLWSRIMIGVSPLVWEFVWVRPAKNSKAIRDAMVTANVTTIQARKDRAA